METVCFSETLISTYKAHSVTTQNNNIDIFTAVRTSNLTGLTTGSSDYDNERGEISGSHGGEYEDDCLLGCHAM
jgi:hypothetical protein